MLERKPKRANQPESHIHYICYVARKNIKEIKKSNTKKKRKMVPTIVGVSTWR